MLLFGIVGGRRVGSSDDFATARRSYGPLMLALAYASTVASGATFLGVPGLAYSYGLSAVILLMIYPVGVYTGLWLAQKMIASYGNRQGARSIAEYLGLRYQSEAMRIMVALFSLILLTYLAGQLVAGLVMFEMFLGLSEFPALVITTVVLLIYVTMGGAHADILTDAVQATMMLIVAVVVGVLFFAGAGTDGNFLDVMDTLAEKDAQLVGWLNGSSFLTASIWAFVAMFIAHLPLGLLPHNVNKLWALKNERDRNRFLLYATIAGMILPILGLGGLLARVVLGDVYLDSGGNGALPALFIELFPPWLAALLGIGVLAAVMSTADGLVISTGQVFANDLFRLSILPRLKRQIGERDVDRLVLRISRIATLAILVVAASLAWVLVDINIALMVWIGIGGLTAAIAGPLIVGGLWRRTTSTGAMAGFLVGAGSFVLLHSQILPWEMLYGTTFESAARWINFFEPNPYMNSMIGILLAVATTILISLRTRPLPEAHLAEIFSAVR